MKKLYPFLVILSLVFPVVLHAQTINPSLPNSSMEQPQPFLFTINTLNAAARGWSLSYSGGYGEHTVTPLGYDGIDQNIAVKGYLGAKFTMLASMGVGFGNNGEVRSMQQAEVLRDFIGGNKPMGFRIGASLGYRHEFNNDNVALSRITAAFESPD